MVRDIAEYSNKVRIVYDDGESQTRRITGKTIHDHGMKEEHRSELREMGYELVTDKIGEREYPEEIEVLYLKDTSAFREELLDSLDTEDSNWRGEVYHKLFTIDDIKVTAEIDNEDNSVYVTELNGVPLEKRIELEIE